MSRTSSGGKPTGVYAGKRGFIRAHATELARRLPEPGEELHGLPEDGPTRLIRTAFQSGILRRKRACNGELCGRSPSNCGCVVIEVDPDAYRIIQNDASGRETLDCGHTGFRNLGGGEYTCGNDRCDAVHDREHIEGVYG